MKKEIEEMERYKWSPFEEPKTERKESKLKKQLIEFTLIMIAFVISAFAMQWSWKIALTPLWVVMAVFIYFYIREFIKTFKKNIRNEQIAREEKEEESKKA